ncbi:MAG: hypothetical protein ACI8RD_001616 [Bacillariaceae sp.]|jgi:hypothetical protein
MVKAELEKMITPYAGLPQKPIFKLKIQLDDGSTSS